MTIRLAKPQPRRDWSPTRARLWLIVIVLVGVGLRFTRLGFPSARTDEGFTYWRTCGTFGQLFDTLRLDAFVPLHYEQIWVLTKLLGPDLWVMRLPAAVFGSLMPIAVYSLARIIFGRRVGVMAAIIAMSSAYFSFYARDAKMYMSAWCLTAFATAAAFGFLKTGRRLSWLQYVFFGIAAVGSHSLMCLPVGLISLASIGIARRKAIRRSALIFAGLLAISIAPAIYYMTFNRWFVVSGGLSNAPAANIEEPPHNNGLMWVERWQDFRGTRGVLMQSLGAFLFGYEFPPNQPERENQQHWGAEEAWKLANTSFNWLFYLMLGAAACAILWRGRIDRAAALWFMVALILVPLYGFYLRSYETLAGPWELLTPLVTAAIVVIALIVVLREKKSRLRAASWFAAAIALFFLVWLGAKYAYAHAPVVDGKTIWNPLWMPRYAAIIATPLLVMVAVIFARLPTSIIRWAAIVAFAGVNLAFSIANITCATGWPDDVFAADAAETLRSQETLVLTQPIFLQPQFPLVFRYYHLAAAARADMSPTDFRTGNQWPYRLGPGMTRLVQQMRVINWLTPGVMPRVQPNVNRIVIWSRAEPMGQATLEKNGWSLVSRNEYLVRVAWTWDLASTICRTEYVRKAQ